VTVTVELPPLQRIGVALAAAESSGGCVIVTEVVPAQLFASVTVKECVPAGSVKVPVPLYGATPPVAITVTVDVPPLQGIGVAFAETVTAEPAVMVTEVVAVQLFASVTVKVYVPGVRVKVPVPEYGAVPPVAVTVTVELLPPQRIGVADAEAESSGGWVIVTVVLALQLFASVTVMVCVPAG
jgi:hypothetical protein